MKSAKILSLTFLATFASNQLWASQTTTLPSVVVVATPGSEGKADGYKAASSSSSTRTSTPLLDTPQSVSVVTQDQIRDQNITKMEEAARYVPGVNVQMGEGHRDQVTIRGMTNGSNGTTANFFIDGARDDAEYIRDFYNIESIEFLKGPNAMAFGRGSPGGAINRVAKSADGLQKRRLVLTGGSFENRRAEFDVGDRVNDKFALRLNSMYQKSNSYRDQAGFERYGFNPTATVDFNDDTKLQLGYEHFDDQRALDRGIPSVNGAPLKTSSSTFFGIPNQNDATSKINSFYGILTHDFDATLQLKNNMRYTKNYKIYQNVVPGAITGGGSSLSLSAYQDKVERDNFTNQTDLTKKFETGSIAHTALLGAEITSQKSVKVRNNGIFSSTGTKDLSVPLSSPIAYDTVSYSTLKDHNKSEVRVLAAFLQDQVEINKYVQLTAGVRLDRFEMKFKDYKNNKSFDRTDVMVSPRAGLVIKPQKSLSLYTSYGVTYQPSSGDQFNSLDVTTDTFEPEKVASYEIGAKWDVSPKLNLSAALFQLDRSNTPTATSGYIELSGQSRTKGFEFAATGKITNKWQTIASYAFQNAELIKTAKGYSAGNKVALVPHNSFALWNKYDFTQAWAAGLGVVSQSSQYADAANSVRLKGFSRLDGALYYKINSSYRAQVNVENILNRSYVQTAHSATNALPGSPRAFNVALIADF
ncbi:MAG: TonB-dependent siderophore receptor [Rickettsiales bacterium]|nr:TonB-dependent siderophore receptor [Rickettsiales bacterium]